MNTRAKRARKRRPRKRPAHVLNQIDVLFTPESQLVQRELSMHLQTSLDLNRWVISCHLMKANKPFRSPSFASHTKISQKAPDNVFSFLCISEGEFANYSEQIREFRLASKRKPVFVLKRRSVRYLHRSENPFFVCDLRDDFQICEPISQIIEKFLGLRGPLSGTHYQRMYFDHPANMRLSMHWSDLTAP